MASQEFSTWVSNSHRPLPYSAPSATERLDIAEEITTRATQGDMPTIPTLQTEPSDPSLLKHLVVNPDHVPFHNAARSQAVDRTSQLNLNLPTHQPGSAAAELFKCRSQPRAPQGAAEAFLMPTGDQRHRLPTFPVANTDAARSFFNDPKDQRDPTPKIRRGAPRTRFHHLPGSAGIPRRQQKRQDQSRPRSPIVHHSALQRSNLDARSTSRARRFITQPPSCNECPEDWLSDSGFDPWKSLEEKDEIVHSAPLQICSRKEMHGNKPYYVCATCRVRAAKHREKHFRGLVDQFRGLQLCNHCATFGLTALTKPGDMQNGKLRRFGCTCGNDWLCFECDLHERHVARATYDAEKETRRGIVGVGVSDDTRCVWISDRCICGTSLQGHERTWICTTCRGISFKV